MYIKESGCADCGLPCMGKSCPKWEVSSLICDKCGEVIEEKCYESESDKHYCARCFKEQVLENIDDILMDFEDEIADYLDLKVERD